MLSLSRSFAVALGAALLCAGPATARAAAAEGDAPDLGASITSCTQSVAVFTGSMPGAPNADRLGMRFSLQVRSPTGGYGALKVPAFGTMQKSKSGVGGYVLDKKITRLLPGSAYRVVVDFRWYDEDGKVVKKAQRTSTTCAQSETRPDLGVLAVSPAAGGFAVTVRNNGPGDATDPFAVGVAVSGKLLPSRATVGQLAAGQNTTVLVAGPACAAGTALSALVDVDGAVDESDESDNALSSLC